jgi:hypothetical protein
MWKLAPALAMIAVATGQAANQQSNCAPKERVALAIRHARMINTAEANDPRGSGYRPLSQLGLAAAPDGYQVQLTTDGTTYSFSIKDTTDACRGVVFSDQEGVIYTGVPLQ